MLGEEATYCDQKVSAESDGFADGYQPENALWVMLEDACGGCAPELSCDGKQVMTQAQVCSVLDETAVCAITGTLSELKTCTDSEYCVSTAGGADCAPCNCTPGIICDENDKAKGVKTLETCNALGVCDEIAISCADLHVQGLKRRFPFAPSKR